MTQRTPSYPITRVRLTAEGARLAALHDGLSARDAKIVARYAAHLVRHGHSQAMAINHADRYARAWGGRNGLSGPESAA